MNLFYKAKSEIISLAILYYPFCKNSAKFILKLAYGFKLWTSIIQKKHIKTLITYRNFIRNNLNPNRKILNHDLIILKTTEKVFKQKNIKFEHNITDFTQPKILILNSEIYDNGGHTEVAIRFIKAFKDEYLIDFYLTTLNNLSKNTAPVKSAIIKNLVNNYTELSKNTSIDNKITELYNYIISNKITTVCVNIHTEDVVCCAVLGLLKKYTNINIIFWNHASHCYSLGTEFADIILTRCENGKAITPYLSNKTNVIHIPFLESTNDINMHPLEHLFNLKQKLNIPQDAFITITGAPLHKVNKKYFRLLNKILQKHKNVYHIFISTVSIKTHQAIKKLFGKNKDRFIISDSVLNFDLFIQMSDLYIDSFPQGSALTLVDFIKHAKPVLIKINEENRLKSFATYLYPDYEYSCKTTDEMFEKISTLISNKQEYVKISQKVKEYYAKNYNIKNIKKQHRKLLK